ncbi:helix-turn-helix domain-containing protein [Bradyrhizobium diazoefficiens]|uniref:helix-turn-helix domain-containing protein n=1 Tax=Bradyrhizobium diazoefficiens TaxID=1355477 RepID=UPI001604496B
MNQQSDDGKLGDVYTFDEVCTKLRLSRQSLSDLIRGTNFYSRKGRVYRFSDADILAIWTSMRSTAASDTEVRLPKSVGTHGVARSSNQLKLLTGKPRKRCDGEITTSSDLARLFTGRPHRRSI